MNVGVEASLVDPAPDDDPLWAKDYSPLPDYPLDDGPFSLDPDAGEDMTLTNWGVSPRMPWEILL
jgi:hypothetical protein